MITNLIKDIIEDMAMQPYKGLMKNKHLSVAIYRKNIITDYKYNQYQNIVLGKIRGTIHAEMNVITSILRKLNRKFNKNKIQRILSNIIILVIRISKEGLKYSKPCYHCLQVLKEKGIKKICYTTGDNNNPFVIESINQIHNDHFSSMMRFLTKKHDSIN